MRGCWSTRCVVRGCAATHAQTLEYLQDADVASLTFSNEARGGENPASELSGRSLQSLGITYVSRRRAH